VGHTGESSSFRPIVLSACLAAGLAGIAGVVTASAAGVECRDLAALKVPDTVITSADVVAAGAFTPPGGAGGGGRGGRSPFANLPAFCRVIASLRPTSDSDIGIELWLPASGWNGKFQAIGQGGLAGDIPYSEMATALAARYATSGTDTGHVGSSAEFAIGHREKLIDFAYRAFHELAGKSKTLITAHYGKTPDRSYFNGCSGGGRHGITSAQRYPTDFDGIIAGASSWNQPRMDAARIAVNRLINRTPEGRLPREKFPMVHEAVLKACDTLDGVKDGIIENPTRCTFDLKTIECKGADSPSCLTPAQVESAKALVTPLRHPKTGAVLFEGHLWPGAELSWGTLSSPEPPGNVMTRMSNFVFKNPKWDINQFNIETDVDLADKLDGGLLRSDNYDLRPFFGRGGKLIMWHGWIDPQVTPQNSIIYYTKVRETVGREADNSIALFMLPGVAHCSGGPGPDTFDRMASLEAWVERGQKPTRIIASRIVAGKVERTRPLCPWGQVAKWNGSGSTDDAANFSCVAESMTVDRK
jgi:tannase/feruloyl esterase